MTLVAVVEVAVVTAVMAVLIYKIYKKRLIRIKVGWRKRWRQ